MKKIFFKSLLLAFLTLSAVGLSAQTSQTLFVKFVDKAEVNQLCQQ